VQRRQQGPVVYETETIDRSHADRILAVDGEPMRSGVQFRDKIWQYRPGDVVKVTIQREGRQMDVPVTLGSN
jgi:S1-C subfamily serine protease